MIKRPVGFTLISLLLIWLGFAGILNAIFDKDSIVFTFVAFIYGITAIVAAIGLWKIKKWSYIAYLFWCGAVILTAITMQLSYRFQAPIHMFLPFTIFIMLILAGGAYFIHRKFKIIIAEQAATADRGPLGRSG